MVYTPGGLLSLALMTLSSSTNLVPSMVLPMLPVGTLTPLPLTALASGNQNLIDPTLPLLLIRMLTNLTSMLS